MSKHVQTRSNSCVQILKSENMEQSRVTWVCLQVLSASGWILACFRAHQGPTNCPRCQSSTDPHRKLSNQSRHDENFRGCESWNAQNGCKNDVARRGMTWQDVTRYTMIWCNMMSLRFNFQWSLSLDNLILSIILDFWIRSEIHCDEIPNMMKILVSFLAGSNFLESCFFWPKCIGTGYPPKSCQLGSGCWHSAWNKALRPAGSACNLEDCLQI